jgi:hypothetical protein
VCNPLIAPEQVDGRYLEVKIKSLFSVDACLARAILNLERVRLKGTRLNLATTDIQNAPRRGMELYAGKALSEVLVSDDSRQFLREQGSHGF